MTIGILGCLDGCGKINGSAQASSARGGGSRRTRYASVAIIVTATLLVAHVNAWAANPVSQEDVAAARLAFSYAGHNDWNGAESVAVRSPDALVYKLVRWLDLQRKNSGHSFEEITGFISENPSWPKQMALRQRAEDVMDPVPDNTLRDWFSRYAPLSPMAKIRYATLLYAGGDADKAKALMKDAWINGDFNDVDEKLALARVGPVLTGEDNIRRTDRLLWSGKDDQAARMLSRLPDDWRLLFEARLQFGLSASGADQSVERVPAELQNDPGLLFDRIRWYRKRGLDDAAIAIFQQAPSDLDHPEHWWTERQTIARDLLAAGDAKRALDLVADHRLKEGTAYTDAEFLAGWIALRFLKNPDVAFTHFYKLYDAAKLPLSLSRGAYWIGRAADAQGNPALAKQWYNKAVPFPLTYYGQLAAGEPGADSPPHPSPEPRADMASAAIFNRKELVRAVRLLTASGQDDAVRPFFTMLNDDAKTVSDHALVADLADEIGRADLDVAAAKQAARAGISLFRAGYPIVPLPRNAGAEQALLLAVTRQESAFDAHAISPTDARGLMQLEPGTAKLTAKNLQIAYSLPRLTGDPLYNVTLGQAYLDSLLSNFNGSYVLAIAAYNAGPCPHSSMARPVRRSARHERRCGRLDREYSIQRDPELRPARSGEPSGLPAAHRRPAACLLVRDRSEPLTANAR